MFIMFPTTETTKKSRKGDEMKKIWWKRSIRGGVRIKHNQIQL